MASDNDYLQKLRRLKALKERQALSAVQAPSGRGFSLPPEHPIRRAVVGVMKPPLTLAAKAVQTGGELIGQPTPVSKTILKGFEAEERARQAAMDNESNIIGDVASIVPAAMGGTLAAKVAPVAGKGLIAQTARGAAAGAGGAGILSQSTNPQDYLYPALFGGGIGAISRGGQALINWGKRNLTKEGMLKQWLDTMVAPQNREATAKALERGEAVVKGRGFAPPTAAEAVQGRGLGAVMQEGQKVVSRTPPLVKEFVARGKERARGVADAVARRNRLVKTQEAILNQVNAQGGVPKSELLPAFRKLLQDVQVRDNPAAKKLMRDIYDDIANMSPMDLNVNAHRLYMKRRLLTEGFKERAETLTPGLKNYLSGRINKIIDVAIQRSGGGKEWKSYLKQWAKESRQIGRDLDRAEQIYKPVSPVQLQKAANVAPGQVEGIIPTLLTPKATIPRWIIEQYAKRLEPQLDISAKNLFMNPSDLANVIRTPAAQSLRAEILRALTPGLAGTVGGSLSRR